MTTRKSILDDAAKCVCGDRETEYGSPENNFSTISDLWRVYIRAKYGVDILFSPDDAGIMLSLVKIARIASGQVKADNYIDLAGYAACAGEIALGGQAMTVFISGAISGDPNYKAKFAQAEKTLTEKGYIVLNPAWLPSEGFAWEVYMRIAIAMLRECEAVCFWTTGKKAMGQKSSEAWRKYVASRFWNGGMWLLRYDWWGYVKGMIRRYPKLKEEYEDLTSQRVTSNLNGMPRGTEATRTVENLAIRELPTTKQREFEAVRRAIEATERYSNGRDRLKVINLVFWKQSHTIAGAAFKNTVFRKNGSKVARRIYTDGSKILWINGRRVKMCIYKNKDGYECSATTYIRCPKNCAFYTTEEMQKESIERANKRLRKLPRDEQKSIAETYYKGNFLGKREINFELALKQLKTVLK